MMRSLVTASRRQPYIEHRQKQLRNAYYKITPNLLFEYQCTSGKFIRLPNRIKKIEALYRNLWYNASSSLGWFDAVSRAMISENFLHKIRPCGWQSLRWLTCNQRSTRHRSSTTTCVWPTNIRKTGGSVSKTWLILGMECCGTWLEWRGSYRWLLWFKLRLADNIVL